MPETTATPTVSDAPIQELKLLAKAIRVLDSAILRFNKSVQEMQAAVGVLSSALEDITACTEKLQMQNGFDEFNSVCLAIHNCVADVQASDSAQAVADNTSYVAAHEALESLREQTEGLCASEKARRKAQEKLSKLAASPHSRKHQQSQARLESASAELLALQTRFEYALPSTLCEVLHRGLQGSSQFCRALGTTLLCCGHESRRYSQSLQPPSSDLAATPANGGLPKCRDDLTDEQRKGLALQDFARHFFVNATTASRTFPSLSGFCDSEWQMACDRLSHSSSDSSGCAHTPNMAKPHGDDGCLWSPVEMASPISQLLPVGLQEAQSPAKCEESYRVELARKLSGTSRRTSHRTPSTVPLQPLPWVEGNTAAGSAGAHTRSLTPPKSRKLPATPSAIVANTLSTVGEIVQLENDSDCPF